MNTSPTSNHTDLHVIVGAGATGSATARQLAEAGVSVRIITRSGSGPLHPNIERIAADAAVQETLASLTEGATALYNCANPKYHRWTTDWPPLAESLLNAAEASGAVLVTLSNLYGYAPPTKPMRATDPLNPRSIKGAVRADMWMAAKAAHDAGRIRTVEVRASDFIGPDLGQNGHMGDRVVPRLLAGKSVSVLGGVDVAHSWTAIDDVAATLIASARNEQTWGRAWHVPTAPPMTQTQLVDEMARIAGVDTVTVSSIPNFAVTLLGLVMADMRELKEVMYQFEAPFVVDSSETTEVLGLVHTPLEETLQKTIDSYRTSKAAQHS